LNGKYISTDNGSTCKIFSPGNAPVYLAPQVMATGNLPLVVPSPAPLVQPFQAIHPIMVPAASSMIPGKYM